MYIDVFWYRSDPEWAFPIRTDCVTIFHNVVAKVFFLRYAPLSLSAANLATFFVKIAASSLSTIIQSDSLHRPSLTCGT
jgi:hypothetical protein